MLTVEDGTGLANADSLVTVSEVRAFALARGATVSNDDAVLEPQIRLAHDYLAAIEPSLQGSRAVAGQALPFPRKCVVLFGSKIDKTSIPTQVKNAIAQLVIESIAQDLMPVFDGRQVTQEVVGPISTTYAAGSSATPTFPRVDTFLQPLMSNDSGMPLTLVRV